MIATATLEKEHRDRWWDFWTYADLGRLQAVIDNHVAWIWDGDKLVAEFTPDNTGEFIAETLAQLRGN